MKKSLLIGAIFLASSTIYAGVGKKVNGTFNVNFNKIYAVTLSGNSDTKHNNACNNIYSSLLGTSMSVHYIVDPETLFETASIQYLGARVLLHPTAIGSNYDFMSDGVGQLESHNIYRIIVDMDSSFSNKVGEVMLRPGNNESFQCVLNGPGL